ncbi:hypothetical protein [Kitasatospora sp. NE20-6]|uniref:hypothetical protein n=1 Tax=Kitasatospora sp. NE20-6 TaxID=2859066 RepID=UPI0038B35475
MRMPPSGSWSEYLMIRGFSCPACATPPGSRKADAAPAADARTILRPMPLPVGIPLSSIMEYSPIASTAAFEKARWLTVPE